MQPPNDKAKRRARRPGDRWAALFVLAGCVFVFSAAAILTPDPSGVGTHTQLGLPPCGFLTLFGRPCPACGLTTALAHLARGSLVPSLQAHPVGLPLFFASGALSALSARSLWRGSALMTRAAQGLVRLAIGLALGLFVVWVVRLAG